MCQTALHECVLTRHDSILSVPALKHAHTHTQAENDVLAKKMRALEAEVAAVREEKRRVERQLSLTVAAPIDS